MRNGRLGLGLLAFAVATTEGVGGEPPRTSTSNQPGRGTVAQVPAAVAGGYSNYCPPYWSTIGPNGLPVVFGPPPVYWGALIPVPVAVPVAAGPAPGQALGGPMPAWGRAPVVQPPERKSDRGKARQLATIGDRLFRAGNVKRAEERYEQAAKSAPDDAAPLVRLAQVALTRGLYADAAERLRQAVDAEPGWLARAPNILAIYGEPRTFEQLIARLESHVLRDPTDRDAWLVLGAELYLTGQTRRAGDVFLRLTDRRPDPALHAFLEASGVPAR